MRIWILLLFLPGPALAQVVEGRVLEAEEGQPVSGVEVLLTDLQGGVLARDEADGDGFFALDAPAPGEFLVMVSALGYRPVRGGVFEVGRDGRIEIEIRLQVDPFALEEVAVEAEAEPRLAGQHPLIANGFVERANRGRGRFLGPQELERLQNMDLPLILHQTGRVEIGTEPGRRTVLMRRGAGLCEPLFVVDDLALTRGAQSWQSLNRADLLGVEVYRSAIEAPIEFQRYDYVDCGVIVVWTRR